MVTRTTDNGSYGDCQFRFSRSMHRDPARATRLGIRELAMEGLTYGRQLEEHRHRQNRPCTFPNCEKAVSHIFTSRITFDYREIGSVVVVAAGLAPSAFPTPTPTHECV